MHLCDATIQIENQYSISMSSWKQFHLNVDHFFLSNEHCVFENFNQHLFTYFKQNYLKKLIDVLEIGRLKKFDQRYSFHL